MKKILKIFAASIAALALTTVLVSATVSETSTAVVEVSSSTHPALDCSLPMSQAQGIFTLLPANIKDLAKAEYQIVRTKFSQRQNFSYKGIKCSRASEGGKLNITFRYGSYIVNVKNVTMEELDVIFG